MLQVRTENRFPFPPTNTDVVAKENYEDMLENAIELLDKLNCFELKRIKELFDQKYEKVSLKDSNYIQHNFIDNYLYIVEYPYGEKRMFCRGEDAYNDYSKYGQKLTRRTKNLFPTYETLLEKDEQKMRKINQKQKQKTDKKDYDIQYAKDNIRQIKFTLNRNTDQDIIEHLDQQKNKQGYLKELIRKDIK